MSLHPVNSLGPDVWPFQWFYYTSVLPVLKRIIGLGLTMNGGSKETPSPPGPLSLCVLVGKGAEGRDSINRTADPQVSVTPSFTLSLLSKPLKRQCLFGVAYFQRLLIRTLSHLNRFQNPLLACLQCVETACMFV